MKAIHTLCVVSDPGGSPPLFRLPMRGGTFVSAKVPVECRLSRWALRRVWTVWSFPGGARVMLPTSPVTWLTVPAGSSLRTNGVSTYVVP